MRRETTGSRVSIKDVAHHAGVSVGTVSNVLNRPTIVSHRTRERVNSAILELGFIRNEPARQLKAGASRTIAYVVLDAANPFFTDVAAGIEDVAEQAGLGLYLCNSRQDPAREARYLDLLGAQRVHGVLITPLSTDDARLRSLPERGTPIVIVDRKDGRGEHCSVSVDDVLGGQLAVSHLIEGGHKRIAYVGGPEHLVQVRDRLSGARLAVEEAADSGAALHVVPTAALDIDEGRLAGGRILGMPARSRPTAVFCANDLLALGLLQEVTQRNVPVPEELAIVGYDDIFFAGAAVIPLSSVRQPRQQLGRTAAELLLDEAKHGSGHKHRQVQFKPELVVRASSNWRTN